MNYEKIDALSEKGRLANDSGELLDIQIKISNVVAEGLADCAMPVTEISAAPIVMVLETFATEIRNAVGSDNLDKAIDLLKELTNTTSYGVDLE